MNNKTVLILVENSELDARGLSEWLKNTGFEIVGPIISRDRALSIIETTDDIGFGIIDLKIFKNKEKDERENIEFGFQVVTELIKRKIPTTIVSSHIKKEYVERALELKVGYLDKNSIREATLPQTIELTINNCVVYSEKVIVEINRIIELANLKDILENIEWAILALRIAGKTYNEIAEKTNYAESTIRSKISSIFDEIDVSNKYEARRWFEENAQKYGHENILDEYLD